MPSIVRLSIFWPGKAFSSIPEITNALDTIMQDPCVSEVATNLYSACPQDELVIFLIMIIFYDGIPDTLEHNAIGDEVLNRNTADSNIAS